MKAFRCRRAGSIGARRVCGFRLYALGPLCFRASRVAETETDKSRHCCSLVGRKALTLNPKP